MSKGAKLVFAIVKNIKTFKFKNQFYLRRKFFKESFKIYKKNCLLNLNSKLNYIFFFIKSLSLFFSSYIFINNKFYKIFFIKKIYNNFYNSFFSGSILSDGKNYFCIFVQNGMINIIFFQITGKKPISIKNFFLGGNI